MRRPWHYSAVLRLVVLLVALTPAAVLAQSPLQGFMLSPPCEGQPQPAFAQPGAPPAIATWNEADANTAPWRASPCLRWTGGPPRMITALAGTLQANSLDELLDRYAALSRYPSIRFWSTTHQAWEPFANSAGFVDGPEAHYSQPDLKAADFVTGRTFYYYEIDRTGRTIHRLTVHRRTQDAVELSTDNVTAIRYAPFTVFEAEALKTSTFIQRLGPGEWGYYQTIGAGAGADFIAVRSPSPYINRLTALYRYMAGIPADSLPPAAPR